MLFFKAGLRVLLSFGTKLKIKYFNTRYKSILPRNFSDSTLKCIRGVNSLEICRKTRKIERTESILKCKSLGLENTSHHHHHSVCCLSFLAVQLFIFVSRLLPLWLLRATFNGNPNTSSLSKRLKLRNFFRQGIWLILGLTPRFIHFLTHKKWISFQFQMATFSFSPFDYVKINPMWSLFWF